MTTSTLELLDKLGQEAATADDVSLTSEQRRQIDLLKGGAAEMNASMIISEPHDPNDPVPEPDDEPEKPSLA
ncbi:hypothetical protein [Alteromonas antoniana]|uniref:hypothetical protein n=1 Tax=Alteromonas antoniana TaxID=2803813 RepID=UPI001C45A1D8|nr:hypothetical protein [Alteromonas antoniana]